MEKNQSSTGTSNKFANDGSFMEMFRKQLEKQKESKDTTDEKQKEDESSTDKIPQTSSDSKASDVGGRISPKSTGSSNIGKKPLVGKRRGPMRVLKTGIVLKKPKPAADETDTGSSKTEDAWSKYLKEVNDYKSKMCIDDDKSRPLVK